VAQSWRASDAQCFTSLIGGGDLQRRLAAEDFAARRPAAAPGPATTRGHFPGELRRWRRRELTRIAWRDLAGWADLGETVADLTAFADTAIATAWLAPAAPSGRYGEPRSGGGEVQPWSSSAWASLGGGETEFLLDVDLVLLFPSTVKTDGPHGVCQRGVFHAPRSGALVRLLETPGVRGLRARVDLRLRPFGDSGPPGGELRFVRGLPAASWARLGAVRVRQKPAR